MALAPDWSPDARWLVVGNANILGRPLPIYLLSTETGAKQQVTFPPANTSGDSDAAISPNGRSLAFVRHQRWGRSALYVVPLNSESNPKPEPQRLTLDDRYIGGIAWNANGREIVFSSGQGGTQVLWRQPVSGAAPPQPLPLGESAQGLLPPNALNTAVAIARRGNRLAYTKSISDTNIGRVSLTDTREPPAPFINSTRPDLTPQYSPDVMKVAFESDRSGQREVWVCNADGSNPVQVTAKGGNRARWSPDSQQVVLIFFHELAMDAPGFTAFCRPLHVAMRARCSG